MKNRIYRLPNGYIKKRRLNALSGKLACEVSNRWIQFPDVSKIQHETDYLCLDIMTLDLNERERKLCEIIVDKPTLLKILNKIPTTDMTNK